MEGVGVVAAGWERRPVFVIIFVCVFVFVFVVVPPQLDLHQQAPHRSTGQLAKPSEGLLSHFQRSFLEVEFDQKKTSNQIKIACLEDQGGGDAQTRLCNFWGLLCYFLPVDTQVLIFLQEAVKIDIKDEYF